jgi:2-hydroxychromene-2-carboxylate isomerase
MRGAVAMQGQNYFETYVDAVYDAIWVNKENMGELEVIGRVLADAGLDAEQIIASTQDPEVKTQLISNTEAAVALGCFGAPTMFMDGQMFFGQDRIQFIEMALQ